MLNIIPQYNSGDEAGKAFRQSLNDVLHSQLQTHAHQKMADIEDTRKEKEEHRRAQREHAERQRIDSELDRAGLGHLKGLPKELQLEGYRHMRPQNTGVAALTNAQTEDAVDGLVKAGIPEEQARGVLALPKNLQATAVKDLLAEPRRAKKSQEQAAATKAIENLISKGSSGVNLEGVNPNDAYRLAGIAQNNQKESAKDRRHREDLAREDINTGFKETAKFREEIWDSEKKARNDIATLDRMAQLDKKNELDSPLYISLLKKAGLDIPAMLSPGSAEYEKLRLNFLNDASKIFGGKVSNFEAQTFLDSIPSLQHTKEGRERIVRNMRLMRGGELLVASQARKIIKSNGGNPPRNLMDKVYENVGPELDKISNEFVLNARRTGTKFKGLPNASTLKNKQISGRDGKVLTSNGINWVDESGKAVKE